MHRTTPSNGGLFKTGNIFGGSKTPTSSTRPSTSSGSPGSESKYSPTHQQQSRPSVTGFSRKTSFSSASRYTRRNNSTAHLHSTVLPSIPIFPSSTSPEKRSKSVDPYAVPSTFPIPLDHTKNADSYNRVVLEEGVQATSSAAYAHRSSIESFTSTTPYSNMLARPGTGHQSTGTGPTGMSVLAPMQPGSPTLETITYQHIQEMASKRISTLDYLRKAYDHLQPRSQSALRLLFQTILALDVRTWLT